MLLIRQTGSALQVLGEDFDVAGPSPMPRRIEQEVRLRLVRRDGLMLEEV